ncbi:MAG: hypothetical protein V2I36_10475 [Desulfopila sp.]|nr:hypothetical protein [Desulfopila sp.]
MITIAIFPIDSSCRAEYLENFQIPLNYMSDFSLMGFVVDRYNDAITLLTSSGYPITKLPSGAEIVLQHSGDLLEIQNLLLKNRIQCHYSDIVDSLYQA